MFNRIIKMYSEPNHKQMPEIKDVKVHTRNPMETLTIHNENK